MPEFDATLEYKPIPSLPTEFYRAGSDGTIWGCQKSGAGAGKAGEWKQLKGGAIGKGYAGVRLGINGAYLTRYVHRLVLEAFVGPCPEGMEGCHNNGNKADNRIANLRWDTPTNNSLDRNAHGTDIRGSQIPWAKLTEEQIPAIRQRLAAGDEVKKVAADFGVHKETIRSVQAGRTWRHVP
jgi:hypothetical protein